MHQFTCPYLKGEVELTQERKNHIIERHPELAPDYRQLLADTLMAPDSVRCSVRLANARLFSRWFAQVKSGKHLVVVVIMDPGPSRRHWIVTAYLARRLAEGETEWQRN
jgi:hypothetical protein